jgi:hypothetical protein
MPDISPENYGMTVKKSIFTAIVLPISAAFCRAAKYHILNTAVHG